MNTKLFCFAVALFFFGALRAQENSASAPLLVAQDWFPPATVFSSGNLGTSGSGVAVCTGVDADDVWYRFVATTQAAKITIQNPVFDAVIQLLDNALNPVACENSNVGNATEILRYNALTVGAQYYFRVHSFNGIPGAGTFQYAVEYYPLAEVRSGWYPIFNPDDAVPGYKVFQTVNRSNYGAANNALIQATRWLFTDTNTGEQCSADVNGVNAQINLNVPGCICYDKFYDVQVQVKVENYWCGYATVRMIDMENYPTTSLEPLYAGQYYNMDEDLKAIFVGNDQLLEWELVTDNGQTVLDYTNTSSYLYFNEVPCVRYNKVYNVRIRCSYCGGPFGPWSPYNYVIMNPLPYTNVKPQFCNTWQYAGATLLCDFVDVADQYAWQFAPIEMGDPTMTPIGPAIVVYSDFTNLFLLTIGLQLGTTYRVGVKPFVGYEDTCDDVQEGDYGYFCPVSIIDPANPPLAGPGENYPLADEPEIISSEKNDAVVFSLNSGTKIMSFRTAGDALGTGVLRLFDLSGREVFTQQYYMLEQADLLQVTLPDLAPGTYIVALESEGGVQSDKIFLK